MPINYQVKKQKFKVNGVKKDVYFASIISKGETSLEELETMISKISAASEGDVRSILRTMTDLISANLCEGRTVVLGDLGRLRTTIRSKASGSKEDFSAENIKRVRVVFSPSKRIRQALGNAKIIHKAPVNLEGASKAAAASPQP